jgi:hypothetical protein
MAACRQETIVYLLRGVPGHIAVKVNPPLDNTATATDFNRYIRRLARNQRGNSNPVFIIVYSAIVTESIGVRLAVRLAVGPIVYITKPGAGNRVVGAVVYSKCRITCRNCSGRSIAPVVFYRLTFPSWINQVVLSLSKVVPAGRSGATGQSRSIRLSQ